MVEKTSDVMSVFSKFFRKFRIFEKIEKSVIFHGFWTRRQKGDFDGFLGYVLL